MVGVIGCGSFGLTIAKLLSKNNEVLVYCRKPEEADQINQSHEIKSIPLPKQIKGTNSLAELTENCLVIFPVIPSEHFRSLMSALSEYLNPKHMIIHATKGLDLTERTHEFQSFKELIHTMSQIVTQETRVLRVGCVSGPNLARELLDGQPAAAVIASEFHEVIEKGKALLSSDQFYVFGSTDLIGTELASSFKNIIALASGLLDGFGYGKNMQSVLITRGLNEMMILGKAVGAKTETYLGVAGIGDLIATSTSTNSRNYSFGKRLAKGEDIDTILKTSEVVEGVRTLKTIHKLSKEMQLLMPLTDVIFKIVFTETSLKDAIQMLMKLKEPVI